MDGASAYCAFSLLWCSSFRIMNRSNSGRLPLPRASSALSRRPTTSTTTCYLGAVSRPASRKRVPDILAVWVDGRKARTNLNLNSILFPSSSSSWTAPPLPSPCVSPAILFLSYQPRDTLLVCWLRRWWGTSALSNSVLRGNNFGYIRNILCLDGDIGELWPS